MSRGGGWLGLGAATTSPREAPLSCRPQPACLCLAHPLKSGQVSGAGQLLCGPSRWPRSIRRGPCVALGSWAVGPGGEVGGGRVGGPGTRACTQCPRAGARSQPWARSELATCCPSSRQSSCVFGTLLPTLCSDAEDASGHPLPHDGCLSPRVRGPRGSQVYLEVDLVECLGGGSGIWLFPGPPLLGQEVQKGDAMALLGKICSQLALVRHLRRGWRCGPPGSPWREGLAGPGPGMVRSGLCL